MKSGISLPPKSRRIIVMVVFAAFGVIVLAFSKASTITTSTEAEMGVSSPAAQLKNDASASAGSYSVFGGKGRYILYTSNANNPTAQIWRMKSDGSEATQLTNDANAEHHWVRPSPDGKSILFYKQDKGTGVNDGSTNRLWVMNADGSNQHEVLARGSYGWNVMAHGEWSPDSQKIVMAAGSPGVGTQIFTINPDGSGPTQITQLKSIDGSSELATATDPSWPKQDTILFVRAWGCFFLCSHQDVASINITTGVETRLTNDDRLDWDPYLSADGSNYLWLKYDCIGCSADLYTASGSGPFNPRPLIADGGTNASGTLSYDGKYAIFPKLQSYGLTVWYSVYRIAIDGSGLTKISKDAGYSQEGMPSYWP